MRSVSDEDLTARARIRNAALAMLSERGIKATTIRAVAEAAGVSPALVQHHFGSKEKLREACDEYVMDYIRGATRTAIDDRHLDDPEFLSSTYETAPPVMAYLGRALVDGSPAAAAMFDEIVDITERYLKQHAEKPLSDNRAQAAVFTAMKLGVTVLHNHVARALGADALNGDAIHRVGRAGLDIISPEFVGKDIVDLARDGISRYQQGESDE
ncbi:TetR/AcrR family transcriptional regulator [Fodinicola acaciae]|uniref:TetR/AcrR family transcriptional regulator n=1 Tax=Fodinicola acaciae TaxID=2681555 RepID=UPI001FE638C4|nr:TetR/AcrR family transcriptional regulator [Fodinicola acaciae]